jgi:hypothetical protein
MDRVEALNDYLHDPRGVVKGTKMAFAGLKKDQEVAGCDRLPQEPGRSRIRASAPDQ